MKTNTLADFQICISVPLIYMNDLLDDLSSNVKLFAYYTFLFSIDPDKTFLPTN